MTQSIYKKLNYKALGTIADKNWSSSGTPARVTKDDGYYFEFRKDKRWYFGGVVGY